MTKCKLLILILFLILFKSMDGQWLLDPYRFVFSRYVTTEQYLSIDKWHHNYVDFHFKYDSIEVDVGNIEMQLEQRKYGRTTENNDKLIYYFQRRKFAGQQGKMLLINNCKIIETNEQETTCSCAVGKSAIGSLFKKREIVVFQNHDIEGLIVGMRKYVRIILILVTVGFLVLG